MGPDYEFIENVVRNLKAEIQMLRDENMKQRERIDELTKRFREHEIRTGAMQCAQD